jgi:SAM-dependent methyltransferase
MQLPIRIFDYDIYIFINLIDKVDFMDNLVKARLDKDLTALAMVRKVMVKYALDIVSKQGIIDYLTTPRDLSQITKVFNIKNTSMLENILDILVGYGILGFGEGKYYFEKNQELNIEEAEEFLRNNYRESLEWIKFVNQYSENTLISGRPSELTGFEEDKSVYYWNKIMEQSPYSLRIVAISELYKDMRPGALVLDYGCGGGVGLEQLISLSTIPLYFIGVDPSEKFFAEAKKRIDGLYFNDLVKENNRKNVVFDDFDNLDKYVNKLDGIFISIIFNHINQEEHVAIFKKLHRLLKTGGKLAIVQLLDFDKFNRNPIWVMHNIPSHKGYPLKGRFVSDLKSVFSKVDEMLDGMVTISTK